MPTKYVSEIPYASVTDTQINSSTETSVDDFFRSIRAGDDNVLIEYNKDQTNAFSSYDQLTDSLDTLRLQSDYSNQGLNDCKLIEVRSTTIEIGSDDNTAFNGEVTDVIIVSGGTGYSAGTLFTDDTYGSGFDATYTVDKLGAIDSVTVINSGSGYVSAPLLYISGEESSSGKLVSTITASLVAVMSASANTSNKLTLPLKIPFTCPEHVIINPRLTPISPQVHLSFIRLSCYHSSRVPWI